jgi:hypothetical protein
VNAVEAVAAVGVPAADLAAPTVRIATGAELTRIAAVVGVRENGGRLTVVTDNLETLGHPGSFFLKS